MPSQSGSGSSTLVVKPYCFRFRECQWPCRPVLPRDASTSSQTLLDLLPLELWQKILSYLNDNDGYLYSLLEASEKFAELLPKSSHLKLSDDGFWHAALLKRGCFKSTAGWLDSSKDGSFWRRRYNYVVHSMACFPCFSDITPADEITPLPQFRDSFMGRISREVEKLGRASVCSRHLIRQPSAYSRSDIVDVQVFLMQKNLRAQPHIAVSFQIFRYVELICECGSFMIYFC